MSSKKPPQPKALWMELYGQVFISQREVRRLLSAAPAAARQQLKELVQEAKPK